VITSTLGDKFNHRFFCLPNDVNLDITATIFKSQYSKPLRVYFDKNAVYIFLPDFFNQTGASKVGLPDPNPNLDKNCRVLQRMMLVYFMTFGIFYGHFVLLKTVWVGYFVVQIWYTYIPNFGMLHQEKSGNPVQKRAVKTPSLVNFLV
jgi:hypothetical protein